MRCKTVINKGRCRFQAYKDGLCIKCLNPDIYCNKPNCNGEICELSYNGNSTIKCCEEHRCSFEGCGGIRRVYGLCVGHNAQRNRGEKLRPLEKRRERFSLPEVCSFEGCDKDVESKSLCAGHRRQQKAGKKLSPLQKRKQQFSLPEVCSFEGCNRDAKAYGLCAVHRRQQKAGKELRPIMKMRKQFTLPEVCSFEGCNRDAKAYGFCQSHGDQNRQIKNGKKKYMTPFKVDSHNDNYICTIHGCNATSLADDLCTTHWIMDRYDCSYEEAFENRIVDFEPDCFNNEQQFESFIHDKIKKMGFPIAPKRNKGGWPDVEIVIPKNKSNESKFIELKFLENKDRLIYNYIQDIQINLYKKTGIYVFVLACIKNDKTKTFILTDSNLVQGNEIIMKTTNLQEVFKAMGLIS